MSSKQRASGARLYRARNEDARELNLTADPRVNATIQAEPRARSARSRRENERERHLPFPTATVEVVVGGHLLIVSLGVAVLHPQEFRHLTAGMGHHDLHFFIREAT